jgi:hypothetical protein
MREEKGDQVVPQNHPACACADHIQEREWMFEKLKVYKLAVKVEKAKEELKPISDKKEGARKRRTSKPHIRWDQQQAQQGNNDDVGDWIGNDLLPAANELKARGWVGLPS